MRRVLVDANVIMDVLFDREPHAAASRKLLNLIESRKCAGMIAAHNLTTIFYLISKEIGRRKSLQVISTLIHQLEVAPVSGDTVRLALQLDFADFEDAVVAAAAMESRCDAIVTRDPRGFKGSAIDVLFPEAAVAALSP